MFLFSSSILFLSTIAIADRAYPSSDCNAIGARTLNGSVATANGGARGPPAFPPTKAQQYGPTRLPYRPPAHPPPRRRKCCCACYLWLMLLIALVFLVALAAGVFYVLYHPQHPSFSVDSLRLSALNLTSSNLLTSHLDLAVTAWNPNRKIIFLYDDVTIFAYADRVPIGEGLFPAFIHGTKNTTILKATVSSLGRSLEPEEAEDLRKRKKFALEIDLDTKAGVKISGFKSKLIGIRVSCDGIDGCVNKISTADARCQVKLRIKIWN